MICSLWDGQNMNQKNEKRKASPDAECPEDAPKGRYQPPRIEQKVALDRVTLASALGAEGEWIGGQ